MGFLVIIERHVTMNNQSYQTGNITDQKKENNMK